MPYLILSCSLPFLHIYSSHSICPLPLCPSSPLISPICLLLYSPLSSLSRRPPLHTHDDFLFPTFPSLLTSSDSPHFIPPSTASPFGSQLRSGETAAIVARELAEQTKGLLRPGDVPSTVRAMAQLVELLDVQLRNLTPGGKDSAARSLTKVMQPRTRVSSY